MATAIPQSSTKPVVGRLERLVVVGDLRIRDPAQVVVEHLLGASSCPPAWTGPPTRPAGRPPGASPTTPGGRARGRRGRGRRGRSRPPRRWCRAPAPARGRPTDGRTCAPGPGRTWPACPRTAGVGMVRTDSGTDAGAPMAVGSPGTVVVVVDEDDELPHPASTDAAASAPTAVIAHLPVPSHGAPPTRSPPTRPGVARAGDGTTVASPDLGGRAPGRGGRGRRAAGSGQGQSAPVVHLGQSVGHQTAGHPPGRGRGRRAIRRPRRGRPARRAPPAGHPPTGPGPVGRTRRTGPGASTPRPSRAPGRGRAGRPRPTGSGGRTGQAAQSGGPGRAHRRPQVEQRLPERPAPTRRHHGVDQGLGLGRTEGRPATARDSTRPALVSTTPDVAARRRRPAPPAPCRARPRAGPAVRRGSPAPTRRAARPPRRPPGAGCGPAGCSPCPPRPGARRPAGPRRRPTGSGRRPGTGGRPAPPGRAGSAGPGSRSPARPTGRGCDRQGRSSRRVATAGRRAPCLDGRAEGPDLAERPHARRRSPPTCRRRDSRPQTSSP